MTTETIKSAIAEWAGSDPFTLETTAAGRLHLTIAEPPPFDQETRASVFFDLSPSGEGSTFSMSREGEAEYATHAIPAFQSAARLIRHLQRYRNEFFRDYVYGPRFEAWMDARGLAFRVPEYDFYITGPDWAWFEYRLYEISDPASGMKYHVGIHGNGSAATFTSEEEDILLADDMADLPNPAAMIGWIEKALNLGDGAAGLEA